MTWLQIVLTWLIINELAVIALQELAIARNK